MFHRPGYIFTDKKNPERGIMSAILGVLGILAMLEKDIFRMFPVLGIILNSLTLIAGCMILYIGVR